MIYLGCGLLIFAIGVIWLISPAKKPNLIYGYYSYLARQTEESFRYAQKIASLTSLGFGLLQALLGVLIHFLNWDRFFILWLITMPIFILAPMLATETKLKAFLKNRDQLPPDYINPDDIKRKKTKGFKDL